MWYTSMDMKQMVELIETMQLIGFIYKVISLPWQETLVLKACGRILDQPGTRCLINNCNFENLFEA